MSGQDRRDFLAADNVGDWVALHGRARAVSPVLSLGDAARPADPVAQAPGIEGAGLRSPSLMTSSPCGRRAASGSSSRDPSNSHERSRAPRNSVEPPRTAPVAGGPPRYRDTSRDRRLGFWRAVLGYAELPDDNAVDPLGHGSTDRMRDLDETKPMRHAMDVDVSSAREPVGARLAAALAAWGRMGTVLAAIAWKQRCSLRPEGRARRFCNNATASIAVPNQRYPPQTSSGCSAVRVGLSRGRCPQA